MNTVNIKYSPYPNKFSEAHINAEGEEKVLTLLLDEVEVPKCERVNPSLFFFFTMLISIILMVECIHLLKFVDSFHFFHIFL